MQGSKVLAATDLSPIISSLDLARLRQSFWVSRFGKRASCASAAKVANSNMAAVRAMVAFAVMTSPQVRRGSFAPRARLEFNARRVVFLMQCAAAVWQRPANFCCRSELLSEQKNGGRYRD